VVRSPLGTSVITSRSQDRTRLLALNSAWNLLRAASNSAVVIGLPLVLVFQLPAETFAVWALMFSISSFVIFFDLGLYPIVRAKVAREARLGSLAQAHRWTTSGVLILTATGCICTVAAATAGPSLDHLFGEIPAGLVGHAAVCLVILTVGQACFLVLNGVASYFSGLQRSKLPALVATISRLASMALVLVAATRTSDLIVLAAAFSVPTALGALYLVVAFARERHADAPATTPGPHRLWKALLRDSGPLIVWSACVLAVSGAGTAIVGAVDFQGVAAFAVSASLALGVTGVGNAVVSPLLPELSHAHAGGDDAFDALVSGSFTLNAWMLTLCTAGSWVVGWAVLAGRGTSDEWLTSSVVLVLVTTATSLRLSLTPISMAFIASGTHRRVVAPPILDAVVTLALCLALGTAFGVVGVSSGLLAGAAVAVVVANQWSTRLTGLRDLTRTIPFSPTLLRATLCCLPTLAGVTLAHFLEPTGPTPQSLVMMSVAYLVTCGVSVVLMAPAAVRRRATDSFRRKANA
jgi:O-antigen/teichoic acid export membrane protein